LNGLFSMISVIRFGHKFALHLASHSADKYKNNKSTKAQQYIHKCHDAVIYKPC
jgi:hypothetical protein